MADCKKETYFVAFFIKLTIIYFCVWTTHSMYETTHTKKGQEFIIYFYLLLPLSNSRYKLSVHIKWPSFWQYFYLFYWDTYLLESVADIIIIVIIIRPFRRYTTTTQTSWTWYFGHLGIKKTHKHKVLLFFFYYFILLIIYIISFWY